jgi:predicted transcriptional regulator
MIYDPDFGELLFTLSNDDRLSILSILSEKEERLTELANSLDSTPQETSRNITRLQENQLIERTPDMAYKATPYGVHIYHFISPLRFLYNNRGYFKEHTLSVIPSHLLSRIGELEGASYSDDVMYSFHNVVQMIEQADEYIWIMSNQILMSTIEPLHKALQRGVNFRLIIPSNIKPPPEFLKHIEIEVWEEKHSEMRIREKCDYIVTMSEKAAITSFPTTDRKIDYHGFHVETPDAHDWCRDLFLYSWNQSLEKPGFFENLQTSN